MSYHKENLKEKLVEIAWEICKTESWQKVNMRLVAEKAGVSTTAFYRHFKNKTDLKAELMRKGFQILYEGMKDLTNNFSRSFVTFSKTPWTIISSSGKNLDNTKFVTFSFSFNLLLNFYISI